MLHLSFSISMLLMPGPVLEPIASFRCKQSLVIEGDRRYDVRRRCGAPASAERHTETRGCGPGCWETVVVDAWVYDLGPQRLVQHLAFENSILVRIETGDRYGQARQRSSLAQTPTAP